MEHLSALEIAIIRIGIFLIFVVTFGDYVIRKVWPILAPLLRGPRVLDLDACERVTHARQRSRRLTVEGLIGAGDITVSRPDRRGPYLIQRATGPDGAVYVSNDGTLDGALRKACAEARGGKVWLFEDESDRYSEHDCTPR